MHTRSLPAKAGNDGYAKTFDTIKNKKMKRQFTSIIFILSLTNIFCQSIQIAKIIDGDTVKDKYGNSYRLLGINTPELNEAGGQEAKSFLDSLIMGKEVVIERDYSKDTIDIYKRHLCYIYLNSIDINKLMIEKGFTKAYTKYPFSKMDNYIKAQERYDKKINSKEKVLLNSEIQKNNFSPKLISFAVIIIVLIIALIYFYYG